MQMNAMRARVALASLGRAVPTAPTMNWQMTMPRAPQTRMVRRPKRSTVQKEIGVEHTLTMVKIMEIRKGLLMVCRDCRKMVE